MGWRIAMGYTGIAQPILRSTSAVSGVNQAGTDARSHLPHPVEKGSWHGLPTVRDRDEAVQFPARKIGRSPFELEHGGNLAQERHAVVFDGVQTFHRVEDFQCNDGGAGEDRSHEDLRLPADVGGRQIAEHPLAGTELERSTETEILASDAPMGQERRLGRTGRASREDGLRAVILRWTGRQCRERRRSAFVECLEAIGVLDQMFDRGAGPAHLLAKGRVKEEEGPRMNEIQAADHFGRLQAKIERRVDHAQTEAGVLDEDVIVQER
jgi:hypothetical protein